LFCWRCKSANRLSNSSRAVTASQEITASFQSFRATPFRSRRLHRTRRSQERCNYSPGSNDDVARFPGLIVLGNVVNQRILRVVRSPPPGGSLGDYKRGCRFSLLFNGPHPVAEQFAAAPEIPAGRFLLAKRRWPLDRIFRRYD